MPLVTRYYDLSWVALSKDTVASADGGGFEGGPLRLYRTHTPGAHVGGNYHLSEWAGGEQ